MGEKMVGGIEPFAAPGLNGMAKVQGVPVDDDGGEQVEAGDPVMLTLRRAVADFASAACNPALCWLICSRINARASSPTSRSTGFYAVIAPPPTWGRFRLRAE